MKIAVISSRLPFPLLKGDKLRLYHQLKYLSQYHKICLISIVEKKPKEDELTHMRNMVEQLEVIHIPKWKRYLSVLLALTKSIPLQVAYFHTRSSLDRVSKIIDQVKPDRIYTQLIRCAPYVQFKSDVPKIIDYMDAFSLGAKRRGKESKSVFQRWFWKMEYKRLKNYERKIYSDFQKHTIISDRDKKKIFDDDDHPMEIITNGIVVAPPVDLISKYDIGFLGNLGYYPNQKAVEYLMEKIIPTIRKDHSALKILIGGINPTSKMMSYASANVKITGYLDRMADAYRDLKIMVAPIFHGSGLQNKILEAMAARAVCVTTSNVNASIQATPNKHILIADTEDEFCKAIDLLLRDRNLRKQIVDAAYLFVKEKYDWNVSNQKLNKILTQ